MTVVVYMHLVEEGNSWIGLRRRSMRFRSVAIQSHELVLGIAALGPFDLTFGVKDSRQNTAAWRHYQVFLECKRYKLRSSCRNSFLNKVLIASIKPVSGGEPDAHPSLIRVSQSSFMAFDAAKDMRALRRGKTRGMSAKQRLQAVLRWHFERLKHHENVFADQET
jgi:hypothetical protein